MTQPTFRLDPDPPFSPGGGAPIGTPPTTPRPASPPSVPSAGLPPRPADSGLAPEPAKPKITAFGQRIGASDTRHEDSWKRTPNTTGTGAIHCKSFHCKLSSESLEHLDRQINEWLDAHPQYEVKFVTTAVGEWQGKVREPNLVLTVWV